MGTGHNNGQLQISKQQELFSKAAIIIQALIYLAEARQASVNKETLDIYVAELSAYHIDDVRYACRLLARKPRRDGETALPELGRILEIVKERETERTRKQAAEIVIESGRQNLRTFVTEQAELQGKSRQEILDGIKVPGWSGLSEEGVFGKE